MRRTLWIGASLVALSGCGGDPAAVGENSAGSIKTTAMGQVVATPTPTPTDDAGSTMNMADSTVDDSGDATGNAM